MEKLSLAQRETEQRPITEGIDFYKFTMGQLYFEQIPDAQVTFCDTNRSRDQLFSRYVEPGQLQRRLDSIREMGFSGQEIQHMAGIEVDGSKLFTERYLGYLRGLILPRPIVYTDERGDVRVTVTGEAPAVTLWETIVLSEKNELYYRGMFNDSPEDYWRAIQEGYRRLGEKIITMQEYNSNLSSGVAPLTFADFGTRRRFSGDWHQQVIEKLIADAPDLLVGTSNVGLANKFGIKPIGTFAHELQMIFAALAGSGGNDEALRNSPKDVLKLWGARYPFLRIALSDTFGTDLFFEDFAEVEASGQWPGTRHDSGSPLSYANKTVDYYIKNGVDPSTKQIIFSDGLDTPKMIKLHSATEGEGIIKNGNGLGTNGTNDLGVRVISQVMKATMVDGEGTCKISDNLEKAVGSEEVKDRYFRVFGINKNNMVSQPC